MGLDHSDEIAWPAEPTRVGPDAGQPPDWRLKYNEARRERRRQQCRAAHQRWLEKKEA